MEHLEELLTPEQLGERLKVGQPWIYRQTRERKIPFMKAGRYLRFRWSEVEAWLREQTAHD